MFFNTDKTVWIVGGGPSLKHFDFSVLRNSPHIAINKAYMDCDRASIIWWSDSRVWGWHYNGISSHPGAKCAGVDAHKTIYPPFVFNYVFDGVGGLSRKPGILRSGNNSGYACINLAVQLGAKNIGLLGFDMKLDSDGSDHYHDGYPGFSVKPRTFKEKMVPYFDTLIEPLSNLGVSVVNYNDSSDLKCFPIRPLSSVKDCV